jgi:hypothetical protein
VTIEKCYEKQNLFLPLQIKNWVYILLQRTGGSIHDGSLFPFQKLNTLQLNAISHSPDTCQASTLSDVPHKTLSTGPLLVISQHELTLLQSQSPNTVARPASTFVGHKLSLLQSGSFQAHVLLSQFPSTNSVFQPTGVSRQTHASTLSDISHKTLSTGSLLVISQHELTFLQWQSPNTGARPASTFVGHKLSLLQSGSFQTHVLLSQFPSTNSVFQPTAVSSQTHASTLGDFQTRTDYKSTEVRRQQSRDYRSISVYIVACVTMLRIGPPFELLRC